MAQLGARLSPLATGIDESLPQSAVLVAVDDGSAPLSVVLVQRANHLRLHAGEVAFPGGKCDREDGDHWQTALREAREEIALPEDDVEQLGYMRPLVTRTGIQVTPCIGRLLRRTRLQANPDEIETVFEAPLEFFATPGQLRFDAFDYGGRRRMVPRYEYGDYRIWGITAAILVRLVNLVFDADMEMEEYWRG